MPPRLLLPLLVALVPLAAVAQGAWEVLPNSPSAGAFPSDRFEDLEALGPDTLYITSSTDVYRSTDAGASWTLRFGDSDRYLRSLGFVSGTHGFVGTLSGAGDVFFETTDGGLTLTPITDRITGDAPLAVCGIFALDSMVVYAVGGVSGGSHFLRTLDGGRTWTSTDMSAHALFLIDVHFFDRQRGLAVGAIGLQRAAVVLGTEDGGQTWTERFRSSGDGEWGWKISFPTPEVGYVSVERGGQPTTGRALKTEDGGRTWMELSVPAGSMQGVGFVTPQLGWVSGRGEPYGTTDGGLTWSPDPSVRLSTNRFVFFGDTLGYAVADRVLRYRPDATPAEPALPEAPAAFWIGQAYPNPFPERALFPYHLPAPAEVTLEVFDALGRQVAVVERGLRPAGPDELLWWGTDAAGRPVAAGVYVYRLRAGRYEATGRVVKVAPAR